MRFGIPVSVSRRDGERVWGAVGVIETCRREEERSNANCVDKERFEHRPLLGICFMRYGPTWFVPLSDGVGISAGAIAMQRVSR